MRGRLDLGANPEQSVIYPGEEIIVGVGIVGVVAGEIDEPARLCADRIRVRCRDSRSARCSGLSIERIEVQCGDYLGEDDIVRLEDNYGREGTNT